MGQKAVEISTLDVKQTIQCSMKPWLKNGWQITSIGSDPADVGRCVRG
jgi:hypothetical protein